MAAIDVDHNLTNHAPKSTGVVLTMELIRGEAKALGRLIQSEVPYSREQSLALTNLEQTVMWAIAGIARNQDDLDVEATPEGGPDEGK